MEMHWRYRARIVAYIDLLLSFLKPIIIALLCAFVIVPAMGKGSKSSNKNATGLDQSLIWKMGLVAVALLLALISDIYTVKKLFRATTEDADQNLQAAKDSATSWSFSVLICAIIYIGIFLYFHGMSGKLFIVIGFWLWVLLRAVLSLVVLAYMKEIGPIIKTEAFSEL